VTIADQATPGRKGGATQPWNRVVWPWESVAAGPVVWDTWSALRIPGVARATSIYSGSLKQAPMDAYRGITPLPRPRLLDQPDPNQARSWFVQCNVEDYLWNGNAVAWVTVYDKAGWPAAVTWLPSNWVAVAAPPHQYSQPTYMVDGVELDRRRVIHVKRGADRWCPARGVGVIEQHLATLDRVAMEEEYERDALRHSAVPSVAVITPNSRLGEDEAKDAKAEWLERFVGPGREPAILPAGTQVVPLGWSPADNQMVEARKMSLLDVANAFNLDGYWLGAPGESMTYRSPGAMYTNLLRVSLEPVLADFEGVWSGSFLPRGQTIRFDRPQLTRDDLQSTVTTMVAAISSSPPLLSVEEARVFMGLAPTAAGVVTTSPAATVPAEEPAADEKDETP
jgi:HK97 family phage portal protein